MSTEKLDGTDKEILSTLSKNADISYSKLAEKLEVSRNTVYRRVKKMKEKGLIKKNFLDNTIVDVLRLDDIGLSTLLLELDFEAESLSEASEFLRGREEVKFLLETYGDFDVIAIVFCEKGEERESIAELKEEMGEEGIRLRDSKVYTSNLEKLDLTLPL